MPIGLITEIKNAMPRAGRIMALDVGAKTIGLALADVETRVVTPLKTIKRTKFTRDVEAIKSLVTAYDVTGFVIGLPLHMDGSEGRRAQSVRDFAAEFARHFNNPWIAFQDERLSTETVENLVDESLDINKRKAKDRGIIDQLAAAHILEEALARI